MMNRRPIALGLAATLALAGFSACSAPGNTPVAVSDPVSTAASTSADPVDQAIQALNYTYFDVTDEMTQGEYHDPLFTYAPPSDGHLDSQALVNQAAAIFEQACGENFSDQEFILYYYSSPFSYDQQTVAHIQTTLPSTRLLEDEQIPKERYENQKPEALYKQHARNMTIVSLDLDVEQGSVLHFGGAFSFDALDKLPENYDELRKALWPDQIAGFCEAANLGTPASVKFSNDRASSVWVTLENGDICRFSLSLAGIVGFDNLTRAGGDEAVQSVLDKDAGR